MRSTPPPPPPPTPTFAADSQLHAETTVLHSSGKGSALAYLVLQDANATKMPLNKTATRIGRRSDNDLVFSNTSVSGHHAEIHMSRDGAFSITDLGSGNGVYVNGNKVQQHGLRDGDTIELGEVRFRFTL
jgi:pSer/pThr/pTyr-binding forkhead associated (FHA) protein